ncbi:hypothetical protein KQX54_013909 [Cotesia glomerata]|uniref:Uncharacterized protein n=1 Tax=Cotesia glomerata TaxID=32391 RepID=A0AAV7J6N9_COTGL|nr:hypothetical protein KQX54_013909 [Cotesia glomerata]
MKQNLEPINFIFSTQGRKSYLETKLEKLNGEKSPDRVVNKDASPHHDSKDVEEEFGFEVDEVGRIRHRGRDFRDTERNKPDLANYAWDTAVEKHSFTAMGVSLVSALFDMGTLLESNVKGEKSKINKNAEDGDTLTEFETEIKVPIQVNHFIHPIDKNQSVIAKKSDVDDTIDLSSNPITDLTPQTEEAIKTKWKKIIGEDTDILVSLYALSKFTSE